MATKYIVFKTILCENVLMFSDVTGHADVCDKENDKWIFKGYPVVAAGFVYFHPDFDSGNVVATCSGESTTLGIKSRGKEDAQLVNFAIGGF